MEPQCFAEDLYALVGSYLTKPQLGKVKQACEFSTAAHDGQRRVSGEPYVSHPLSVALVLAEFRLDHETLMAAMLHDVIEDTPTLKEEIIRLFGSEVAELVDGVSKLTHVTFMNHAEAQAHNFQKMLLAMCSDIRVILVKLADRLHNMRTLAALSTPKRRTIARETLEIYAPIAQRLGMNGIRLELEELGFFHLYPLRYRVLSEKIHQDYGNRKEIVANICDLVESRMREEGISGTVSGREKHLYSLYSKMVRQGLPFKQIHDVYGFRIITEDVDTCYRLIGVMHSLYKPISGKFKDYIAIPKANGYQSLHTSLFGPQGVPVEIQIRTREMDCVAEAGVAAHWLYKTKGSRENLVVHHFARQWIKNIMEIHKTADDPQEFFEHIKIDLFPDDVYVFTPKGDILKLPRGATAVDFAYAIHSDIGSQCIACLIDRNPLPLSTTLESGQTVYIVTSSESHPSPAWLNFVVTAKARSNIRHHLKNMQANEAEKFGKMLLLRELKNNYGIKFNSIAKESLDKWQQLYRVNGQKKLFRDIGLGNRLVRLLAHDLVMLHNASKGHSVPSIESVESLAEKNTQPLIITGTEGLVVNFPKCCYPVPGDPVFGLFTAGRGIVIHNRSCPNVTEQEYYPDKWLEVTWNEAIQRNFQARITMLVENKRNVLATVAAAIAAAGADIDNLEVKNEESHYATLVFIIQVKNRIHLGRVMRSVHRINTVSQLQRK